MEQLKKTENHLLPFVEDIGAFYLNLNRSEVEINTNIQAAQIGLEKKDQPGFFSSKLSLKFDRS